jgi:hypothetical protein
MSKILSTNTANRLTLSSESTTSGQFIAHDVPRKRRSPNSRNASKNVQNAVYAYVRAIRALGRTQVISTEIASALSLTTAQVNSALSSLRKKGVKPLNG